MCYAISIANHSAETTRMYTQMYNTPAEVETAMESLARFYTEEGSQVTLTWYHLKRQDSFSNYISTGPHTG